MAQLGYLGSEGYSPSIGMFMRGLVINHYDFKAINRNTYVDAQVTKQKEVISIICYLPVTPTQVFDGFKLPFPNKRSMEETLYTHSLILNMTYKT